MATIDGLLKLIASQRADALEIAPNQVPRLRQAGSPMPLSVDVPDPSSSEKHS